MRVKGNSSNIMKNVNLLLPALSDMEPKTFIRIWLFCLNIAVFEAGLLKCWYDAQMASIWPPMRGESSEAQAISRWESKYSSEASSNQLYGQLFVIPIIHISTYCLTQQQENNLQQSASSAPSEGILSSSKYLSYSSIINNNFQSYSQPEIIVW